MRHALVGNIAPRPWRPAKSRRLNFAAAFAAVFLAISCGTIIDATAAGRPVAGVAAIIARAQRGDPAAAARLGWLYATGRGVAQNYPEAAKWFYRAANRGNAAAQFALGMAYNKGQGVPRDYVLSYLWLNLSAAQAVGSDRDFKTTMRDAIASKMTPQQLLTAQQLALQWQKSK